MESLSVAEILLCFAALASTQTPVPGRPPGYVFQSTENPKIVIEAFYDFLCSDSKANWPVLKKVMEQYSSQDVAGIMHIFPLPYHHNAYFMQQASVVVAKQNSSQFIPLLELVFEYQNMFLSGAVNMTEPQVQTEIASFISKNLGVSANKIIAGFTDAIVVKDARYAWKYAASRAITGTPQFIVNGVHVPDAPDYTAGEWDSFIEGLLSQPSLY